jgi:hypothetical protein
MSTVWAKRYESKAKNQQAPPVHGLVLLAPLAILAALVLCESHRNRKGRGNDEGQRSIDRQGYEC